METWNLKIKNTRNGKHELKYEFRLLLEGFEIIKLNTEFYKIQRWETMTKANKLEGRKNKTIQHKKNWCPIIRCI